jgi:hypothetical protein
MGWKRTTITVSVEYDDEMCDPGDVEAQMGRYLIRDWFGSGYKRDADPIGPVLAWRGLSTHLWGDGYPQDDPRFDGKVSERQRIRDLVDRQIAVRLAVIAANERGYLDPAEAKA